MILFAVQRKLDQDIVLFTFYFPVQNFYMLYVAQNIANSALLFTCIMF